jgi:hypothetical protein
MRTFKVSEVVPVEQRLQAIDMAESIARLRSAQSSEGSVRRRSRAPAREQTEQPAPPKLEACASNHPLVAVPAFEHNAVHPLLAAVHTAFAEHYRLVLSPDDIWLCLAQAFARHVEANAEALRSRFVRHQGKVTLKIRRDDFRLGDPSNDWQACFAAWSDQIAEHIVNKRDLVVADSSTTGPIERAASEIVLMSAMQGYFDCMLVTCCGIPDITLLGTVADWQAIRRRAELFAEFDLGDWTRELLPVLDELVEAASGWPDREHCRYHVDSRSGGPYVSGWINVLFPYLDGPHGSFERNPYPFGRRSNEHHGVTLGQSRAACPTCRCTGSIWTASWT